MDVTDMENKIYIVTSGDYSEYRIVAVFSTEQLAEEYVQQRGTEYRIESYNLDEEVFKETKLWSIAFSLVNSSLIEAEAIDYQDNDYQDIKRDTCGIRESFFSDEIQINFFVDADSMDKAVKIARERFAAIKANEYIWLRLTRPYEINICGRRKYETFNVKTNEFTK